MSSAKKILLLSDTHCHLDDRILHYAAEADEVWHAGDFGPAVADSLLEVNPNLKGVYGNIDDAALRLRFPESLSFEIEGLKVGMLHIGGYPGKWTAKAREFILQEKPHLFITGHSHILKVMQDAKHQLLHLNPGAAGRQGWHKVRTMLLFQVARGQISELNVIELGSR